MVARSQSASLAAYMAAMYSLSVVDSEISSWHLALHETALSFIIKAYLDITFQSLLMFPSASAYHISFFACPP